MKLIQLLESSSLFKSFKTLIEYVNEHSLDMQVELEADQILIYQQGSILHSLNLDEANKMVATLSTAESAFKYVSKNGRFKLGEPMIAFNSDMSALYVDYLFRENGIKLIEKPDYWDQLDNNPLSTSALNAVFNILMEAKIHLDIVSPKYVYGVYDRPAGPLLGWSTGIIPDKLNEIYIIEFKNGVRYLCNRFDATSYCRHWGRIPDDFNLKTFLTSHL